MNLVEMPILLAAVRNASRAMSTVTPSISRERTRLAAVPDPRRNVELKAHDPDPERSLAAA